MSRRRRRTARQPLPQSPDPTRPSISGWLLFGLLLGLAGGLYYAWIVSPVIFTDAIPARLGEADRIAYIELVGQAFLANGDWPRAEQRLAALEEPDIGQSVSVLLDNAIRAPKPDRTIRALAALAQQLGVDSRSVALFAPTPATAVPTVTPTVTRGARPAATATETATSTRPPTVVPTQPRSSTATPQPNYRLLNQELLCPGEPVNRLEVVILDALLEPQPGVEIVVSWTGGEDRFFTGFKPEFGLGYADFTLTPGISYAVGLPSGSPEISGLRLETCDDGLDGGWRLTFQHLRLGNTSTDN